MLCVTKLFLMLMHTVKKFIPYWRPFIEIFFGSVSYVTSKTSVTPDLLKKMETSPLFLRAWEISTFPTQVLPLYILSFNVTKHSKTLNTKCCLQQYLTSNLSKGILNKVLILLQYRSIYWLYSSFSHSCLFCCNWASASLLWAHSRAALGKCK